MPDAVAQTSLTTPTKTRRSEPSRIASDLVGPEHQITVAGRRWFGLALRVIGMCVLLVALFSLVDLAHLQQHLAAVAWPTVAAMIALQFGIILLASWRFLIIARAGGADINFAESNRLTFGTTLGNMILPTGLAGDAGRVLLILKFGPSLKSATAIGVFDRIVGLASLSILVLVGSLFEPNLIPIWVLVLICMMSLTCLCILLVPRWLNASTQHAAGRSSLNLRPMLPLAAAISLAAHLGSILIAFVFLWGHGTEVPIAQLLALFPAVLLAASLPVSIGGWGAREVAAAAVFATIGLAAPIAVTLAFVFGISQLTAAGLGTALFWITTQGGQNAI